MGRFFLLILLLQTIDKTNCFLQELFFPNLSDVFYEINYDVVPRSAKTKLCMYFGFVKTLVGFLS